MKRIYNFFELILTFHLTFVIQIQKFRKTLFKSNWSSNLYTNCLYQAHFVNTIHEFQKSTLLNFEANDGTEYRFFLNC